MLRINAEAVKMKLYKNRRRQVRPRSVAELAAMMEDDESPPSTASYIYKVFRAETDVKLSYVERLATALGVNFKDILTQEEMS